MKTHKYAPESLMMSLGYKPELSEGAIKTPIFQTSTYTFKDSAEIEAYTKYKKERYEYGRYGNPTEKISESA